MNDAVEELAGEQRIDEFAVTDVTLGQGVALVADELGDIGPLAGGVVKVVEVVKYRDSLATCQQAPGEVGANEAGAAGDEGVLGHWVPPASAVGFRGGGSSPCASMASTSSS